MSIKARRYLLIAIVIAIGLFATFALSVGSAEIADPWRYIFHPSLTGSEHEVIWSIRFPRIIAALLVGFSLGVAGALSQSATNNPLADPSIIGTSAGASLGAVLALVSGVAAIGTLPVTLFAIVGALLATLITFTLAKSALQLVIVGIATSALISAVTGLVITISGSAQARSISFWSLGSFALANSQTIYLLAPLSLIFSISGWLYSQKLDLLILGDREVRHMGFNPRAIRLVAFLLISILIATAVSAVGSIAFLALAAPHITRFLIGPSNRPLVIGSAVIGAGLLLIADTAARTIAPPYELPVGLLTSIIGAPILIIVLKKSSQVWR